MAMCMESVWNSMGEDNPQMSFCGFSGQFAVGILPVAAGQ